MANEKRLIDAYDAMRNAILLEGILAVPVFCIENVPTVNAVEGVRCKNCRKWNSRTGSCEEFTTQRLPAGGRITFLTREDDFCSYGERRTDG